MYMLDVLKDLIRHKKWTEVHFFAKHLLNDRTLKWHEYNYCISRAVSRIKSRATEIDYFTSSKVKIRDKI